MDQSPDEGGLAEPLLRWTEHPLVDAGVAALTVFASKRAPEEVTTQDLEEFGVWAEGAYFTPALEGFISVLFTVNFLHPQSEKTTERKLKRARPFLFGFREVGKPGALPCACCSRPMVRLLYRHHMPMIGAENMVNFFASGAPGLPVCGLCMTSLQALSLGAPFCSGRAVVLSTGNHRLLLKLTCEWVDEVRRLVSLTRTSNQKIEIKRPRTRVVDLLLRVQRKALDTEDDAAIVVYYLTNSGQGPDLDVYLLPSVVVTFLRKSQAAGSIRADWDALCRSGWERIRGTSAADASDDERLQRRNTLYEDLFSLPEDAPNFIRRYFNRRRTIIAADTAPSRIRRNTQPVEGLPTVSWTLINLFLREVMNMERARVDAIRELGDRLAEMIHHDSNKRLFSRALRIRSSYEMRRLLLDTDFRRIQNGDAPIVTFDEYLTVFEEGEELARADWRLAWDLVLIRMIERLHDLRSTVIDDPDVLEAAAEALEDTDTEAVGATA